MRPGQIRPFVLVCLLTAMPSFAQDNEWSLNLMVVGSKRYGFEGGASARNDGGAGVGLSLVHNFNNYFAIGAEASYSQFNYRAGVAPGAGNAAAGFQSDGTMEMIALKLLATWNLLSGPVTPFLTAGIGPTFLDAEFKSNPPADACWIYPWYGQSCGAAAPSTTLTRLGYNAAVGVRFDLRRQGFIRVLAGGEWIEFSEATSTVGYVQVRADFGIRF